ncbi:hypothetical protein I302_108322 [Kwoniella bestiolae CBS 10118]|uniref:Uncharacterized protein n=1 Tax=Kwoniella bestiolae CBS 10118 TaxID=1296100 RepID=A0A1B9FW09_9TREE|nr:hypothetical protein I302_07309 [Kwoniella bestiolae CBS 10118]OCF22959.1 hypothetical protein I302_07309 [Kwoniella bestiolae CBS 10118]
MPSTYPKETYSPLIHRAINSLRGLSDFLDDERLSRCDFLRWLSDHLDRPPSVLAKASITFLLAVLLLNPSDLSSSLTNALGLLPPAYKTFQFLLQAEVTSNTPGLKKKETIVRTERLRKWMDYWVIYGTTCMLENVLGEEVLLAVIPFWWGLKAAWVIWWMIGLLDDGWENEVRPEPLRLRPRSILATKDSPPPSSDDSSEDEGSPEPPSTGVHEKSTGNSNSDSDSTSSPADISPARAKAIREELRNMDSPPLSRTPEFLPPPAVGEGRAVNPITGISSNSDRSLISGSTSHGEGVESANGSDHDSEQSSSIDASNSESEDESDGSDGSDSDDVRLPPGTPLDELALIGRKTIELDLSDDEESDDGKKGQVERQVEKKETKTDDMADSAKKEGPKEDRPLGDPQVNESIGATKDSAKDVTEVARGEVGPIEPEAEMSDDIKHEAKPEPSSLNPKSNAGADKSADKKEGEVVKLSIEDLLAMDEGDKSNHGSVPRSFNEEKEGQAVGSTAPLEVKRKSGEAKRE